MSAKPWLKQYDSGVPETIAYPAIPVHQMLEENARRFPQKPCTVFRKGVITYAQMDALTDRLAAGLVRLGVKKGDRVGIFMPNTPQFVMAFFAVLKIGGIVVSMNPMYSIREIQYQLKDSGVEVVLVMSNFYRNLKKAQPMTDVKKIIVTNIKETLPPFTRLLFTLFMEKQGGHRVRLDAGDIWMQDLIREHAPEDRPRIEVSPDDFAVYQYSGGTTGTPKGAIAMHRNLIANAYQVRAWMVNAIDGMEVMMMAIPLFHVYGMVVGMLFAMRLCAAMILVPNARNIQDVVEHLDQYQATVFPGVPTLYNAINHYPGVRERKFNLRSIKTCISGSAPLMRETKELFEEISEGKLIEGYGLSETPSATHCNPVLGVNKTGSIGLPFPDVDCRIVDLDDGVTDLPAGQIGELLIKGPQVFHGYHNMPEETDNALRDGWFYTGDIARMDEDGYFYIVDRKKELIKPGGFQVWPREVEEVVSSHPKVLECGVAGIPDPYRGETVKAWIVLKPGEIVSEEEIRAWCKEYLARYKVPTQIEFRSELPKTIVGKILRRELIRQHQEGSASGV